MTKILFQFTFQRQLLYSYWVCDGAHPMKVKQIRDDTRGTAIVEFAIALPVFTLIIFGLIWLGLLMWTQFSLQRSVELAARCATVGKTLASPQVDCNNVSVVAPPTVAGIQTFANNAVLRTRSGPNPYRHIELLHCGSNTGNLVSASYTFSLISLYFLKSSPTLTAQSCYPI